MVGFQIVERAGVACQHIVVRRLTFCALLVMSWVLCGNVRAGEPQGKSIQIADLVGAWQLTMMIRDKNGNNRIDEDERKSPIFDATDNMMLKADGTCVFYTVKANCWYEIKTSSSGNQTLVIHDKDNSKRSRWRIYSLTKDELILSGPFSGSAFMVWKRL